MWPRCCSTVGADTVLPASPLSRPCYQSARKRELFGARSELKASLRALGSWRYEIDTERCLSILRQGSGVV
jgi:hypothetical protein